MPCYDSRDRDDRIRNEKHLNALTALFCAHLNKAPEILSLVQEWKILHDRVDRARDRNDPGLVHVERAYIEYMDHIYEVMNLEKPL